MRRYRPGSVVSLSFLMLIVALSDGFAQFNPPVNVSQTADNSFRPAMAMATTGALHLFWHDFTSSPNLLYRSEDDGIGWTASLPFERNGTQSWEPDIAADLYGDLHLVWRDRTGGNDEILYSFFNGATWSAPENISQSAASSRNPSITVDPDGRPHCLWEEGNAGSVRFFYSFKEGGTWGTAADTGWPYTDGTNLSSVTVESGPDGTIHAVWRDGVSPFFEVYHSHRQPPLSWTAPENVSATLDSLSDEPDLAVDSEGGLHCAWIEQDPSDPRWFEVFYSYKNPDLPWAAPIEISRQNDQTFFPSIVVGPIDTPACAWSGGWTGVEEIYFSREPWLASENVSANGFASDRPALVAGIDGHHHLAWEDLVAGVKDISYSNDRFDPCEGHLLRNDSLVGLSPPDPPLDSILSPGSPSGPTRLDPLPRPEGDRFLLCPTDLVALPGEALLSGRPLVFYEVIGDATLLLSKRGDRLLISR